MDRVINWTVGTCAVVGGLALAALALNLLGVRGDDFADVLVRGTFVIGAIAGSLAVAERISEKLRTRRSTRQRPRS